MADQIDSEEPRVNDAINTDNIPEPKNMQELTEYVTAVLQTMQDRFETMSDQILSRIDDMGTRVDDLEKNINDLLTQAGTDDLADK